MNDPTPESYSRVTNPGRFLPLLQMAVDLLDRLAAEYDVSRDEVFDPPPGARPVAQARPSVRLVPTIPTAAPIAVLFTTFPSLIVRCGRFLIEPFPSCGCDACDETAPMEGERLQAMLGDVVAGRFEETVTLPLIGYASIGYRLGEPDSPTGYRSGGRRVTRAEARRAGGARAIEWQPWPARV
jgi:hypothetical protein